MRILALAATLALSGLAACSSQSGPQRAMETGIGFGDYQTYLQARTRNAASVPYSVPPEPARAETILPPASMPPPPAALAAVPRRYAPPAGSVTVAAAPVTVPAIAPVQPAATTVGRPLAAPISARVLPPPNAAPNPAPSAPAQTHANTETHASPASNAAIHTVRAGADFGTTPAFDQGPSVRTNLSDEQDFQAVSARETIASDRERLARQRAQYEVIEVNSVPDATVSGGPNIVAFALNTSNPPGTQVYRRLNPLRHMQWQSACLQFRNQDAAQEAFLANGGPQRDPGNLDPDGDGYACWWDPTPLRQAMAAAN